MEYIEIHDKRLLVTNPRQYGVMKGAIDVLYQTYNSSSFSDSSYNVTLNIPSDIVACNRIYQNLEWEIELTGTATVGTNLIPVDTNGNITYCAFRAYALDNAIKNVQLQLQNMTFTENVNRYSQAVFPHYQSVEVQQSDECGQPLMPDNAQSYLLTDLTNISPFAPYYDNNVWNTRASFPVEVVSNTPTSAILRVKLTAPIKCSPLAYGNDMPMSGMIHINQIQLQTNFDVNLVSRLFSASPALNITSSSASLVNASASIAYYTPRPELAALYPSVLNLQYYQTVDYITSMPPVLANGNGTVTCNSIELNTVPNCLYLWIDREINAKTVYSPDTFFEIKRVNITYNGKAGILSSALEWDVYNIARDNGYDHTYREWQSSGGYGAGSVLKLVFGKDIPLADGISQGMPVRSNIQIQIDYRNPSNETITPQCTVLVVNEGVVSISDDYNVSVSVGVVTPEDYAMASPSMLTSERPKTVFGSGFWDKLKKFAKQAVQFVAPRARQALESGKVQEAVQRFAPARVKPRLSAVAELARRGSVMAKKHGYGSGLIGGRRMRKRGLKY